jgi:hypothetical protein
MDTLSSSLSQICYRHSIHYHVPFVFDSFGNIGKIAFLTEFEQIYNVGNGAMNVLKRKFVALICKNTSESIINCRTRFINAPRLQLQNNIANLIV